MISLSRIARDLSAVVGCATILLLSSSSAVATSNIQQDASAGAIASNEGTQVPIILTDSSIQEAYPFIPAGKVTFNFINNGAMTHELVILRTDAPAAFLAVDRLGVPIQTSSVARFNPLAPGTHESVTLGLAPGRYAIVCDHPGHYASGMYAGFTVATFLGVTEKEMSVSVDTKTFPAGPVVFAVTNGGKVEHELVLLATDEAADKIAAGDEPGRASEDTDVFEVEHVAPSTFKAGVFDLAPGNYVLICNEPGHYAAGMRTSFSVTNANGVVPLRPENVLERPEDGDTGED